MRNRRCHERLDQPGIQGKMVLADRVEVIDISAGGIAVKADRRLDIGKEYMIRLGAGTNTIEVKAVVVRSELAGMEPGDKNEQKLIYQAGLWFTEGSKVNIASFLKTVGHRSKKELEPMRERRRNVRFEILTSQTQTLSYPAQFKVKEINAQRMLIMTAEALLEETTVPMGLTLDEKNHVDFVGLVVSCRRTDDCGEERYETTVKFSDLSDRDTALLRKFIDYIYSTADDEKQPVDRVCV